jgi:hypothetical protein
MPQVPKDAVMIEPIWIWGKNTGEKTLEDFIIAKKKFLFGYTDEDKYELD